MKKTTHIIIALLVMASTFLTSCNSDEPTPSVQTFEAFVTFEGSTESSSTFTTRESNDLPLVTFTSQVVKADDLTKGRRCYIAYSNGSGQRFATGPITIYQMMIVPDGKVIEESIDDIKKLQDDPTNISLVERSGEWINIIGTASYNNSFKEFGLYVDNATINNSIPDVYIGFISYSNIGNRDQLLIGSFDISPVWNLPTCHGIRLHYRSATGMREQVFNRVTGPVTPSPDPID